MSNYCLYTSYKRHWMSPTHYSFQSHKVSLLKLQTCKHEDIIMVLVVFGNINGTNSIIVLPIHETLTTLPIVGFITIPSYRGSIHTIQGVPYNLVEELYDFEHLPSTHCILRPLCIIDMHIGISTRKQGNGVKRTCKIQERVSCLLNFSRGTIHLHTHVH